MVLFRAIGNAPELFITNTILLGFLYLYVPKYMIKRLFYFFRKFAGQYKESKSGGGLGVIGFSVPKVAVEVIMLSTTGPGLLLMVL